MYLCSMIRDLKNLYIVITGGKAVLFETNLKFFIEAFNKIEPKCRNYDFYYREFKKSESIEFINADGKSYLLQKLL